MLLLDNLYVFRFPRRSNNNLPMEFAVLAALRGQCAIPTPRYEFVAPDLSFAGYRFLNGAELRPALFASLPCLVQNQILDQAMLLVNVLHALDPHQIAEPSAWRQIWTARQFVDRGRARLRRLGLPFPQLAEAIRIFYDHYEADGSPVQVVLHGDLVEDHLLLSPGQDSLAGVLDFGDVGLGDPAEDLKGFWAYGPAAATYAANKSYHSGADPALIERSHRAYLRYRIDRFMEHIIDCGLDQTAAMEADTLRSLLAMTQY